MAELGHATRRQHAHLVVQVAEVIDYQIEAIVFIGVGPEVPILLAAARANAVPINKAGMKCWRMVNSR